MIEPIHCDPLSIKKELLKDVSTIAALDRGCSLTKVMYILKDQETIDSESYNLQCATFLNKHFYEGLMWLVNKATLPTSGEICVTGVGCDKFKGLIEEKTGLKVRFVDEMFTNIKGNHFLLKNFPTSCICYPKSELPKAIDEIPCLMKRISKLSLKSLSKSQLLTQSNSTSEEEVKFPAMIATFGSAAAIYEVREDGSAYLGCGTMLSGRSFIGLSKLLLNTTVSVDYELNQKQNYDEIIDLAEKGDISVLGRMTNDGKSDSQSSYNFPLFPLGNVTENTKLVGERREDVALALLHVFANHLYFTVAMLAAIRKINRIYFAGNLTRSTLLQMLIYEKMAFYGMDLLEIYFLKTGHSGAIGAMVSKPQEDERFEMRFF